MFRRTLSANLAIHIIVATLLLTIIFSSISTYSEYLSYKKNIYQSVNEIILSTNDTASEAIYKLDESIAQTLVDGVVANKYIVKSILYDENGVVLASREEPAAAGVWRPLNIDNETILVDIKVMGQDVIGTHEIVIDMENSLSGFYELVIKLILLKFIEIIVIAFIVYIISVRLVARPVESLSGIIAKIPPGEKAPDIELAQQQDEIGLLARNTINYINESFSFSQQLEARQRERLELEAKLSHSQKMDAIGQLAGGIAHDFNNIMTVVLGNISLSKNYLETNRIENIATSLQAIEESAQRAAKLTKQLLVFSRKDLIEPELIDIKTSIQAASKLIERLVPATIVLEYNLEEVKLVTIDKSQVELILMNLVINARDASEDLGKILIECCNISLTTVDSGDSPNAVPGDYVLLSVSDSGHGISEEDLSRIFEPFYTTKDVGKGTGLGLSTVYSIVDKWNGFVRVESELGKGTTFYIYLPVAKKEQINKKVRSNKKVLPLDDLSGSILICEDDNSVRDLAVALLSTTNLKIYQAADPVEAINISEEIGGQFDILLTDVIMPTMNGKELSDKLSEKCDFVTVYMSGYSAEVIADKGVLEDDILFVQKPFTKEQLFNVILKAIKISKGAV